MLLVCKLRRPQKKHKHATTTDPNSEMFSRRLFRFVSSGTQTFQQVTAKSQTKASLLGICCLGGSGALYISTQDLKNSPLASILTLNCKFGDYNIPLWDENLNLKQTSSGSEGASKANTKEEIDTHYQEKNNPLHSSKCQSNKNDSSTHTIPTAGNNHPNQYTITTTIPPNPSDKQPIPNNLTDTQQTGESFTAYRTSDKATGASPQEQPGFDDNYNNKVYPVLPTHNTNVIIDNGDTDSLDLPQTMMVKLCVGAATGIALGHALRRTGPVILGFTFITTCLMIIWSLSGWVIIQWRKIWRDVFMRRKASIMAATLEGCSLTAGLVGGSLMGYHNTRVNF